ncbi:MAG: AMMECR1 domain-containing protein [Euryarchaeota archaeon RBG_13_61_15]|nr:MAG: AMMECR1 domain-containing protein [Euryarchaeota archaeon RBG_13_61_15]
MFSEQEGELAVRIARAVVEAHVRRQKQPASEVPQRFEEKSGVFVTLTTYPSDDLRGCIGYPEPLLPLIEALRDSAVSACSRDPRFPPVRADDLGKTRVEVSLLTPPQEIQPKKRTDLPGMVKVGDDGLIVQKGWARGLLLPQVPVEWKWDAEEFLCQTCIKAMLPPDSWLQNETKVFKFQAEVFSEDRPGGKIRRRKLSEDHGSCR